MPRPGQPGALHFDDTNVTEFLEEWENECEMFGLTGVQKCMQLPGYCLPDTKDLVKLLPGYKERNWEVLRQELKGLFWQNDKQQDTTSALSQLVKNAERMDLNIYVLKYTAISEKLVELGALSPLDRVHRLLDGLSPQLRERVFEFCIENKYRMNARSVHVEEPEFNKIREFVLSRAEIMQNKTAYENDRLSRDVTGIDQAVPVKPTEAAKDPMSDLTSLFEAMTLRLMGKLESANRTPSAVPSVPLQPQYNSTADR